MTTSPSSGDRLIETFDRAVALPPAARGAYLAQACGADLALRREVDGLIAAFERSGGAILEQLPSLIADALESEGSALVGSRIGPFRLTRLVGSGGMGSVYEGVRADDQFNQRVAIKLIKRGMDTDRAVRRFRRERQILASLHHKNIAALHDGGVTDDGRPYFAIEFVEGTPLTEYCDQRRLGIRDRLQLFRQVAAAVQFAHQSLVIHRDLKPGNILVGDDGTVKLLDFGIAKLLGDPDDGEALTDVGQRAYTPGYASPELIQGGAVSVATDVYSLGVVLFELLAGRLPFPEGVPPADRTPRPSEVVTEAAARARGQTAASLRRQLAGELDNVTLMSLRAEPERRYPSAEALGQDVRRYLEGLTVSAQPDWAGYRIAKFVRRNRVAVALAALATVALVAGLGLTTLEARRADRQATRAELERQRLEQVSRFLTEMLAAPDPHASGRDVTVVQVLDRAAARVDTGLEAQPALVRSLRSTLGASYLGLGRLDQAREQFQRAYRLAVAAEGPASANAIADLSNVGLVEQAAGNWAGADSLWQNVVRVADARGVRDSLYAAVLGNLGTAQSQLGHLAEAQRILTGVVALWDSVPGDQAVSKANALNNLAIAFGREEKWAVAESLHRRAYRIAVERTGVNSATAAEALNGLAGALDLQNKFGPADSAYREVLRLRRRLLGPEHPEYLFTLFNYTVFLVIQNRCEDAIATAREILTNRGRSIPDSHPAVASSLQSLGRCLDRLPSGDRAEAGRDLLESLTLRRKYLPPGHWLISVGESVYGEHLGLVGRFAEGERLITSSYDALVRKLGRQNGRTVEALDRVITFYQRAGRSDRAKYYEGLRQR